MDKGVISAAFAAALAIVLAVTFISATVLFSTDIFGEEEQQQDPLKRFNSCNHLKSHLEMASRSGFTGYVDGGMMGFPTFAAAPTGAAEAGGNQLAPDYSETNIQVAGVDEADIVKTDGNYIYVLSGSKLIILDAYPADTAVILSETDLGEGRHPSEIFINGNKLTVFGREYVTQESEGEGMAVDEMSYYPYYSSHTFITVYDVSDRADPEVARDITMEGDYYDSRMINDYVYVIINSYARYGGDDPVPIPLMMEDGIEEPICGCQEVGYFEGMPSYSSFSTILAINTQDDNEEPTTETMLMGSAQDMYVSTGNIYITYTKYTGGGGMLESAARIVPGANMIVPPPEQMSAIQKFSIAEGAINYIGDGEVPGWILNQFSMDEHNGYFRVATTRGRVARFEGGATSTNNIYVLDEDLNRVGALEDLAPGEQIYSARFMGNRGYLVTFRKIDPFFVIDLSDPTDPHVLGKLKIPGYSDYLHPYDENHIIGIGKETIGAEEGDWSWHQGVKMSLFDVTDVENPIEISKVEIGDRGTDSDALHEHKAFLFDRERELLVIPILLAEINEDEYAGDIPLYQYGEFTFQGAYVYKLNLEQGFVYKGRVTHQNASDFDKYGHYYGSPYSVKRSLYIDDVLYTISSKMIKMNDLDDLDEINSVDLPYEDNNDYYYY